MTKLRIEVNGNGRYRIVSGRWFTKHIHSIPDLDFVSEPLRDRWTSLQKAKKALLVEENIISKKLETRLHNESIEKLGRKWRKVDVD